MSAAKNKGGSAKAILGRGSRQVQLAAVEDAREEETQASSTAKRSRGGTREGGGAKGSGSAAGGKTSAAKKTTPVRREGTKRITVDLPRDEHKFLRDFAYDADSDGMRVVRALLNEMHDNPGLAARIRDRLAEDA